MAESQGYKQKSSQGGEEICLDWNSNIIKIKMNGSIPGPVAKSMGRDKQPFTYLPGGIDFSELKSPKMKKRIDKHLEGSGQSADQKV